MKKLKKKRKIKLRNNFSHRFTNKVETPKKVYNRKIKHKGEYVQHD